MDNTRIEDDFAVKAYNVEINARGPALGTGPAYINLMADGVGPAFDNGIINVAATSTVSLNAGSSHVGLHSDLSGGTIMIGNGTAMGTVRLWQGVAPGAPTIVLSGGPPALDLQVGLPNAGSHIHADAAGIALKFGPTTSVELGAQGIKLTYAAFTLELNAQGIHLNAGPSQLSLHPTDVGLKGLLMDIEAKALSLKSTLPMQVG